MKARDAERPHAGRSEPRRPSDCGRPRAALRPPRRALLRVCCQPDLGARDGRRCFGPGGPHVRQALLAVPMASPVECRRACGDSSRHWARRTGPATSALRVRARSACAVGRTGSAPWSWPVPSMTGSWTPMPGRSPAAARCTFGSCPTRLITLSFASRRRASRDDQAKRDPYGATATNPNIVRPSGN